MMQRIRAVFSGKVQGVGFRFHVQKKAHELKLYGFVMNLPSGDVEMICEGEKRKVNQLLEYCKSGIASAKVTSVDIEMVTSKEALEEFTIKQ